MFALETKDLTLAYGDAVIIEDLNLRIPKGKITVFIGSNGSGKSTLLRSLARLLKPQKGNIWLDGGDIFKMPTKKVAQKLAILPQGPSAPEGLTVLQLVKMGRYPYQSWLQQWSEEDERAVYRAMEATRILPLKDRPVDSLSGGQKQRAWIAMTLAQNTDTILLDEPTTFLDMTHQIEILDLLYELNEKEKKTIVMVLHDINLACRYAHHLVCVKNRTVHAQGKPEEVICEQLIREVFDMQCQIMCDPLFGTPMCIPCGRGRKLAETGAKLVSAYSTEG